MRLSRLLFAALVCCAPVVAAQTPASPPVAAAPSDAPATTAAATDSPTDADADAKAAAEYEAKSKAFYDSLHRQTGAIPVVGGKVTLTVPETHYFVGPEDSKRIIVDVWGNPPSEAENVEGMIFPRDTSPMSDSWGAVVTYSTDGHVSDDDAAKMDYAKLLADMQKSTREANPERTKQGYPTIELTGWAEQPHYDAAAKKLYWAKTLRFENSKELSLNYDIRVLGRDSVLVISFVGGMNQLDAIRAAAPAVLAMPEFAQDARYADYKPGVDKKAAYGIAGLIAGGAALALVKKAGLLGLILAFGKKFIVLAGLAIAAIGNMIRRAFGKKKTPE